MKPSIECVLCGAEARPFCQTLGRDYFGCSGCRAILLDPDMYVSEDDEIYRYETHNNDVEDTRYQNFVMPLVDTIKERYETGSQGLDYGSGTGPVAAKLLRNDGYIITTYDPYFDDDATAFHQKYDFIIASEVVEHFYNPAKEFRLLKGLLRPGGHLACMTLRYSDDIEFEGWHYAHDETHVIFYRDETARWIQQAYDFVDLEIEDRIFILQR